MEKIKNASRNRLRHAAAIGMLKNGASLRHVQEFLGHKCPASTHIYTRLFPKDCEDMHGKFHPRERKIQKQNSNTKKKELP